MASIANNSLDDYFASTPIGTISTAMGNNLFGINHRQTPNAVPINKDNFGLTFFVRPQLNLQTDNLRNVRIFTPLLTTNPNSIQTITRCLLDPRLMQGYPNQTNGMESVFVDPYQAFIPVLTNHLKSITGWPDLLVPTTTTKEGAYKEVHSMVDGITENYTAYDIEATFRNSKGDPIMLLFYIWEHYMSRVYEGSLMPYPDMITENEIDYNTRIYRLILDPTKRYVKKIAASGVSFPTSLPIGGFFDYNVEKPYNEANLDITVQMRCLGFQYNDDILVHEFNKTVAIFNPSMDYRIVANPASIMIQIPDSLLSVFNNRGYPLIDPITYELKWYVTKELYSNKLAAFSKM